MNKADLHLLLEYSHRKSRWHSLHQALDGLSQDEAVWIPRQHRGFPFMDGSIRDIVFHLGADQLVQVSSRFGNSTVTWESVTRRFSEEGRTLQAALRLLEEGMDSLQGALQALPDDDLDVSAACGKLSLTHREFFAMMFEHNLYHAGQIRYIRNLIEGDLNREGEQR